MIPNLTITHGWMMIVNFGYQVIQPVLRLFVTVRFIWSYIDINGNFVIDYYEYGEGYFSGLEDGELIIISRDEVQPGWEEELAAYERELVE